MFRFNGRRRFSLSCNARKAKAGARDVHLHAELSSYCGHILKSWILHEGLSWKNTYFVMQGMFSRFTVFANFVFIDCKNLNNRSF